MSKLVEERVKRLDNDCQEQWKRLDSKVKRFKQDMAKADLWYIANMAKDDVEDIERMYARFWNTYFNRELLEWALEQERTENNGK